MESVIPQLQEQTGKTFGKLHVTFNDSAQISAFIFYTAMMQLNDIPDHDFMNELFAAVQMGGKYQVITSAHQNAEEIGNTIKFLLSKP